METNVTPALARLRTAWVVTVGVVAALPWTVRERLPDPVASHWGVDGRPDGSLPVLVDAILPAVLLAVMVAIPWRAVSTADRRTGRWLLAVATSVVALLAALRVVTLAANLDAPDWSAAGRLTPSVLLAMLAVAGVGAALGRRVGATLPERTSRRRPAPATQRLDDELLVWHGRASAPPALLAVPLVALVAAIAAVLAPAAARGPLVGLAVLVGALAAVFGSVRATVGPIGLVVRLGVFGWPRVTVPLADVEAVEVEDVEPLHYGGWGWRVVPGVRALVLRRGEAIRVHRRSAPTLVVTVDDADGAAGVLAALTADGGRGSAPESD